MNHKLLIASTLVIAASFAISFIAVMDNQANAQAVREQNVIQRGLNEVTQGSNAQTGLVNVGNVAVQANVQLNDVVDVLSNNR